MLISAHKEDLLKEIEHQLALCLDGLMEEDKFLLKCNFDELVMTNGKHRSTGFSPYGQHGRRANYTSWQMGQSGCIPLESRRKRAQFKIHYITTNAYAWLHLVELNISQGI